VVPLALVLSLLTNEDGTNMIDMMEDEMSNVIGNFGTFGHL